MIEEPWIKATILVPDAYLGPILALCEERRGEQADLTYAGSRPGGDRRVGIPQSAFIAALKMGDN